MERFWRPKRIVVRAAHRLQLQSDGTTPVSLLATVFVAQMAGVSLSIGQQLLMLLTLMLTSKGVAECRGRRWWCSRARSRSLVCRSKARPSCSASIRFWTLGTHGVNVAGNRIATAVVALGRRARRATDAGIRRAGRRMMRIVVIGSRGQLAERLSPHVPVDTRSCPSIAPRSMSREQTMWRRRWSGAA